MTAKVVEDFVKRIVAKAVAKAKTKLDKYEKFKNLEFFFSYNIRDDIYFTAIISCEEYAYSIPELSIIDTFTGKETLDDVEAFVESYGTFIAWDYAKSHGVDVEITNL